MATYKTDDAGKATDFLCSFTSKLREIPALSNSYIVFCAERGTGHDSSLFAHALDNQFQPCHMLSKTGDSDKLGWNTSPESKIKQLNVATMAVQEDTVHFLEGWVHENGFEPSTREGVMKKFTTQLSQYGTYESEKGNICVSGKYDYETRKINPNSLDDMASNFCFTLGIMHELLLQEVPGVPYERLFK